MARTELPNGVILPAEYSDDWYEDMTSNLTKLDDVIGSDSEKLNADGVYFLRMSSAALTDSGTGNFSDLNSSYKIKTGDLVLDSGRKLYQIVSVDSANSTFSVGNSLFKVTAESDLAPVAESGDYDDLTDLPTYGITRYCSSAITDNSTVAFSVISSTNKIKAGDFLLDTNGKLYQISSVDTVNQTVSVTTPLTQLAVDANVMHLSGNETVNGVKSFTDNIIAQTSINGVNPGALSFPDLSNGLDISGYITVVNSHNEYTPTVDGWISVILKKTTTSGAVAIFVYQGDVGNSYFGNTALPNDTEFCAMASIPVKAGAVVNIDLKGSNIYVYSAKFYPNLGNV